jgi:hypothetical protein
MIADARRDLEQAAERLRDHARQLPRLRDHARHRLREDVLGARETLAWVAGFPEQPQSFGFPASVALGLREPVRRTLATDARIEYAAVVNVLEEDVNALAKRFAADTAERLGIADVPTPATTAMWSSDPRNQAWAREQLERARQLAEYGNGQPARSRSC